jgi:hypothetical protein
MDSEVTAPERSSRHDRCRISPPTAAAVAAPTIALAGDIHMPNAWPAPSSRRANLKRHIEASCRLAGGHCSTPPTRPLFWKIKRQMEVTAFVVRDDGIAQNTLPSRETFGNFLAQ